MVEVLGNAQGSTRTVIKKKKSRQGQGYNSVKRVGKLVKVRNAGGFTTTDPNFQSDLSPVLKKFNPFTSKNSYMATNQYAKTMTKKKVKRNAGGMYVGNKDKSNLYKTGMTNYYDNTQTMQTNENPVSDFIEEGVDNVVQQTQEVTQDAVNTVKETAGDIWETVTDFFSKYKWWLIGGAGAIILLYLLTSTGGTKTLYRYYKRKLS